ncbi:MULTISPECIES: serine--tRNA ligase [unclassified Acidocella]|uniref:serine--tRNA ligase n=1 Tax=unclassified Acidocella TaxID=2648610 RepID=UPI00028D1DD0|nr:MULTISPECIES: serine--tRNA ligase [unclassified Acidocella]EKN00759.1 seryl-tRNA ligase [Acidocella sp. MX-AZ02]WBO60275.1 serine--tRNA ligase [Acidocella sp. MX-AZ03]
MHDIKLIREDAEGFDAGLARRGIAPLSREILELDEQRRAALARQQELQAERNAVSKKIGEAKRAKADSAELEAQGMRIREEIAKLDAEGPRLDALLRDTLGKIPNLLDAAVPEGKDEADNKVEKTWGAPRNFDFTPKEHHELGEALGMMDFAGAAKLAGARFTVLKGKLARLERALGQFMLDMHTSEHGYAETVVPLLVNDATMYGTGQLPKFAEDLFATTDGRWLIPTAEVPLTNLVAGEITPAAQLPLRMTALSYCFRSEAGSAGRDVRGMLRQHQFTKVELVSITTPEQSAEEHERMTRAAETVLERLELPYRRMLLCAGDTGFSAAKTYDLEVWVPGQGKYREISSCSNTLAFQARRMNARFRVGDGRPDFVHTLNGSGTAVGRALIAVMENYQNEDGSITVPSVLRPYMGGLEIIAA